MNSRFATLTDEHFSQAVQGIWQHLSEAMQTDAQLRDYVRDAAVYVMCSAMQQSSVDVDQKTANSTSTGDTTVLTTDRKERTHASIDATKTVADLKPTERKAAETEVTKQKQPIVELPSQTSDESIIWQTHPSDEDKAETPKAQDETKPTADIQQSVAPQPPGPKAPTQAGDVKQAETQAFSKDTPTESKLKSAVDHDSKASKEAERPQRSVLEMANELKLSMETSISGPARTPVKKSKLVPRVTNNGSAKKHVKDAPSVATSERHKMMRSLLARASFTKMVNNCRLKMDTARSRFGQSQFTIEQLRRNSKQLDKRAKKLGVKLWLRYVNLEATDEEWQALASAFELLVEGLEFLNNLEGLYPTHEDMLGRALPLLYRIVQTVGHEIDKLADRGDDDVIYIRSWLKEASRETGIEVNGLKSKPAVQDCRELLKKLKNELSKRKKSTKQLSKLAWEANKIIDFVSDEQTPDWSTFNRTVNELVNMGEPASSKKIREHLKAVRHFIPNDLELSPGLRQALEFYDDAKEKNAEDEAQAKLAKDKDYSSPRVLKVREMLKGKQITIVGGDATPEKIARITKAFQLGHLEWVTTHHHTNINKIIPIVARRENAAVLLLIRWASHVYNELGSAAKVFVKVTAGYNPNQLAEAILDQASDRL